MSGANRSWGLGLLALVAAWATGCATTPRVEIPENQKPLFLYLPGIEGPTTVDKWWMGGLRDGGFDAHMETYNWTGAHTGLAALQALRENRAQARDLAQRIAREAKNAPSRCIILSANSGGAGVAIWALEDLPPDVKVTTLLLTAPAISPTYDLTRALRHVSGQANVFYSDGDTFILRTGTRTFGTIDGVKCDAAGLTGFFEPLSADPHEYSKLRSFAYRSEWAAWGNFGDHSGNLARPFAEHFIAPLLLQASLKPEAAAAHYF